MGLFDFLRNDFGDGAGGAPGAGGGGGAEGGPGAVPARPAPSTYGPSDRAAARRAREDEETDEFGLHKPAVSWTERLTDYVAPSEVMNDPNTPWYEQIGRGFGAVPAVLAGHVMDALSPVDTRGDWHVPKGPILSDLAEGAEKERYQRERAEKQAELDERMKEEQQQSGTSDPVCQ